MNNVFLSRPSFDSYAYGISHASVFNSTKRRSRGAIAGRIAPQLLSPDSAPRWLCIILCAWLCRQNVYAQRLLSQSTHASVTHNCSYYISCRDVQVISTAILRSITTSIPLNYEDMQAWTCMISVEFTKAEIIPGISSHRGFSRGE